MLSSDKIYFLTCEMEMSPESIKDMVQNDPNSIISVCARISTDEVGLDEDNSPLFNENRLAMVEDIIEELM